jgi:ZIP family zinc transporter
VELTPRALQATSGWMVAIAFGVGGVAYVALRAMVDWLQRNASDQGDRSGMWMVYLAVAVDLFSDGLMIGAGAAVTTSLALVLALGQVLADVPEGFAAIAEFKDKRSPARSGSCSACRSRCPRCSRRVSPTFCCVIRAKRSRWPASSSRRGC